MKQSCGEWIRWSVGLVPGEAVVWLSGLLAMATMDPEGTHLFHLCPLDLLGWSFCPGCGLGHSIAYLARGAVTKSLHTHPLGAPAVVILIGHCGRLFRHAYRMRTRTRSFS